MLRLLPLLAVLAIAAPAEAARVWEEPVPLEPTTMNLDVAADGTTLAVGFTQEVLSFERHLVYRLDAGDPVQLPDSVLGFTGVALPGGGGILAWSLGSGTGPHTFVRYIDAGGAPSPTTEIGPGSVFWLRTNPAGDAAMVLDSSFFGDAHSAVFRPAGGTFGPPEPLPAKRKMTDMTLTSDGDTVIAMDVAGSPTADIGGAPFPGVRGDGVEIYSRHRDGPITGPEQLAATAEIPALAADGAGRALAVWPSRDRTALSTAVRAADGTWGATNTITLPAALLDREARDAFAVDTGDGGEAVIAWREPGPESVPVFGPSGGSVWAMTGSLASGEFGVPVSVDADTTGGGPFVAAGPDGTAVIAYSDKRSGTLRVARREGAEPFGAPEPATCAAQFTFGFDRVSGGVDATGTTTLLVGDNLVRDRPVTGPPPPFACPPSGAPLEAPQPVYGADPIVQGEPTTIDVSAIVGSTDDVTFAFGDAGQTEPTRDPAVVRHAFDQPGTQFWRLRMPGSLRRYEVTVWAPAAIEPLRSRAGMVRVRANAFAATRRARVALAVRQRGQRIGTRRIRLGAEPRTVRIPVSRARHGRAQVTLHQPGVAPRRATVRLR